MKDLKVPELLTPEVIQSVAANAESLKSVLSSGDEKAAMSNECHSDCCCPKLLKFKFVMCNVFIFNENAECQEDGPPSRKC